MAYSDIVKSLPLYALFNFIERRPSDNGEFTDSFGSYNKVEHYFYITKSGVFIDIQPQTGVIRKVISNSYSTSADNYYPIAVYGWKGNKLILHDGHSDRQTPNITIYDPETGEIDFMDMTKYTGRLDMNYNGSSAPFYRVLISSDGHIVGTNFRQAAGPSVWKYNTVTKELEFYKKDSLPSLWKKQFTNNAVAITISTSSSTLNGTYHTCWWDDNEVEIFETVRAEALINNIVLKGTNRFFIHDSDRNVVSATRRVIAALSISGGGTAYYAIDIKNPSIYYKNPMVASEGSDVYSNATSAAWVDQTSTLVNISSWAKGYLANEPFSSATTIEKATYNANYMYSNARTVGRFAYSVGYLANKTYNFVLPIALDDYGFASYTKGDIIVPVNWTPVNYATSFFNNGNTLNVYLCNFGGEYGFSEEDEYVGFFKNPSTNLDGFLSPLDLTFVTYNPASSGNNFANGGFIKRGPISLDLGEFGCYYNDLTQITNTILIDGEEYFYDHFFNIMKSALKKDTILNIKPLDEICDITFTVIPDKDKSWQKYNTGLSRVPTTTGNLLNATEMGSNQIIFVGTVYSGIILKERQVDDSLEQLYFWADNISYKGSLRISSTKLLLYGYMSRMDLIDISDLNDLVNSQIKLAVNTVVPEIIYASLYTSNIVFIVGSSPRTASYLGGYGGFGYTDLTTKTSFLFPNVPLEIKKSSGQDVRNLSKLTSSSYSDSEVETKFSEYITTYGLTRNQGISNFVNTVSWSSQGIEAYNDSSGKFIISLYWKGISALTGIRINEQADGSGLWYTDNATPRIKVGTTDFNIYPKVVFVNKTDKVLNTLVSADYKFVSFTDLLNKVTAGRIVITTDYIVFLDHDSTNSKAVARVISKTNFETAANGTGLATFDNTIDISLSSTSTNYGFGSQGGDYNFYSVNGTPRNSYFVIGNKIFVTISSNTPVPSSALYPAIICIDVAAGTYSNWCIDSVKQAAKGITYNPDTDIAFFSRGASAFRIPNFSTLTPPYTLV